MARGPTFERDRRRTAPAADRNKAVILAVLKRVLPDSGLVVEVASGTGQHVVHFARELRDLDWQPSDPNPDMRASIDAWIEHAALFNVRRAVDLDVCREAWPVEHADALLCINMIHIAPWAATEALMAGASRLLDAGRPLYLYGPYRRNGEHTAPSNASFDAELHRANPAWGVRDLEAVITLAEEQGFRLEETVEMPANNLSVVLRRRPA